MFTFLERYELPKTPPPLVKIGVDVEDLAMRLNVVLVFIFQR
jgi:hypothetical protein